MIRTCCFFSKSFDPTLGWVRKKNSTGIEKGEQKQIFFKIDEIGSRTNSNSGKYVPTIACFGDSYAFCRQVDNDETWEYFLSEFLETGVINFGVGNYGLDQALIRYKNTDLPTSVNTVIMAVVPETICRIQSNWKHYLEFGNTFAFKPKFFLENGHLKLQENPMQNEIDFLNYREKLPFIQSNDRFYKEKFRKFQFRFPYTISFIRNRPSSMWREEFVTLGLRTGNESFTIETVIRDMASLISFCEVLPNLESKLPPDSLKLCLCPRSIG